MNQQCKVCGEPAAGFHFGAFTCEGCKSFFGRTYNNLGSISECKNGGVCVINKKNRTACKACRLRKCLMVGMSKSGSRYGRRSNWFKIHCLLQEQTGNSQGVGGLGAAAHFGAGFLPGFLPSLQSAQAQQQSLLYGAGAGGPGSGPGKPDARDQSSPSQEDLALQSHLLHVAMLKQQHQAQVQQQQQHQQQAKAGRGADKSLRPDDLSLQSQLKLLAWQKEEERASQQQQQSQTLRASPGSTSAGASPPSFAYKDFVTASAASGVFSLNFAAAAAAAAAQQQQQQQQQQQKEASGASLEVFRPFLPVYTKRSTESPSESCASSGESGEELPLHERSASSSFGHEFGRSRFEQQHQQSCSSEQLASSGASSERELPPRRRVNATVTLTATAEYLSASRAHHHLLYPPAELVTPATTGPGHALRGGDLLLASPSPGGLAVEQCEPIDLSVRSSRLQRERQQREAQRERDNRSEIGRACASGSDGRCSRSSEERDRSASPPSGRASAACSPEPASPPKPGNPLDLSLEVKRPAEVSL